MRDLIESFGGMKMKIRTVMYKVLCTVEKRNVSDMRPFKLHSKRIKRSLVDKVHGLLHIYMNV